MNASPIRLRLSSGSLDPGELRHEPLARVDVHERHAEVVAELAHDLLALALAHQPVVDEDAGQLVADRAVHEQRRDGAVDAAREPAEHLLVADLGADALDLLLDHRGGRPGAGRVADARQEVLQQLLPRGVCCTSGWNCTEYRPRSGASIAATPIAGVDAVARKPSGRRVTESLWLIQQLRHVAEALEEEAVAAAEPSGVLPNSAVPVRPTSPPSACAIACMP